MSPKKKIYLYLIIFGAVSLFFLFLITPHFLGEIRENSESLIFLKNELIFLQREIKNLRESELIYQSYQANLAKIDKIFVDPEVPIEFIDFLEKNAQVSQQKIEISLIPKKKVKDEPWPGLLFQVSTFGSFPNFSKFLEKLENSPYLIEILNLNIKKLTEREIQSAEFPDLSPGDVKSTFLIKVFVKK